jgi:hypothetical protein
VNCPRSSDGDVLWRAVLAWPQLNWIQRSSTGGEHESNLSDGLNSFYGDGMKKLAKQRRMLGLSQHELSRRADVKFSRLTFAETGRVRLTESELDRIRLVLTQRARRIAIALAVVEF